MERIDDLHRNGYKIVQDDEIFCFGMDAVLLSDFAKASFKSKVLDIGTGNGIIPILMEAKNNCDNFVAIEIQKKSYNLAKKSVELNNLTEKITVINDDKK